MVMTSFSICYMIVTAFYAGLLPPVATTPVAEDHYRAFQKLVNIAWLAPTN